MEVWNFHPSVLSVEHSGFGGQYQGGERDHTSDMKDKRPCQSLKGRPQGSRRRKHSLDIDPKSSNESVESSFCPNLDY